MRTTPLRNTPPMTQNAPPLAGNEPALPSRWQAELSAKLAAGEKPQAWIEIDLDNRLQFATGIVLVTDRRLLAQTPGETNWQEWPLRAGLTLNHHDHAGVGALELRDENGRLACWRYTLAHNLAALRVIAEFDLQRDALVSGHPAKRADEDVCPKCR